MIIYNIHKIVRVTGQVYYTTHLQLFASKDNTYSIHTVYIVRTLHIIQLTPLGIFQWPYGYTSST